MKNVKAVVFDLDGVIVDSERLYEEAGEIVVRKRGVSKKITKKILASLKGRRLADIWSYLKDEFDLHDTVSDLASEHSSEFFRLVNTKLRMMKGSGIFIEKIKDSYKLALTTSGSLEYVQRLRKKFPGVKSFNCVVTGNEVKKGKPDPEPYIITCKKLGVKPKETIVIEDTPNGVRSAKAAGCICIAVTFTFAKKQLKEADYIADSFNEVKKILGVMNGN